MLIWFALYAVFVHMLLGDSGYLFELFALFSGLVFFLINHFKNKV
jgi:hypothetical protein